VHDDDPGLDRTDESDFVDEPAAGAHYRMIGILSTLGVVALGAFFVVITGFADTGVVTESTLNGEVYHASLSGGDHKARKSSGVSPSMLVLSRTRVLDTVYTTDSIYLEVNLTKQNVTVHDRKGGHTTFLISSGNPAIREGMSTPEGLFTVQNMTPLALSKQFNNAKLHNWIGVQGGVGFHGLDGTGYYGYLGVRPSSHGCMRMSREEIKRMYSMVHTGALIMVHYGKPARVVAFTSSDDTVGATVIDSAAVYNKKLGSERMDMLYSGQYWSASVPRLVHLAGQRFRWGMQIGRSEKIPKQELPKSTISARYASIVPRPHADRLNTFARSEGLLAAIQTADSMRAAQSKVASKEETADPVN
jgi:hypothetical protein